jgi:hypothetical protein
MTVTVKAIANLLVVVDGRYEKNINANVYQKQNGRGDD